MQSVLAGRSNNADAAWLPALLRLIFDAECFAYIQVHVTGAFQIPYLSDSWIKFTV